MVDVGFSDLGFNFDSSILDFLKPYVITFHGEFGEKISQSMRRTSVVSAGTSNNSPPSVSVKRRLNILTTPEKAVPLDSEDSDFDEGNFLVIYMCNFPCFKSFSSDVHM